MPAPAAAPRLTGREALAEAYRSLGEAGLIAGSGGNVSVRLGALLPSGGMLISPTGITPATITSRSIIATDLVTPERGVSSEWGLHAALYRARPDIRAIVHTHADACTALACLGEDLPAFHYEVALFGGEEVRCAPYVTFGTPELATLAVAAMQERTACLLANHGMIAAGTDLASAVAAAHQLERLCRQYLLARSAGQPKPLSSAQVALARDRFRTYQQDIR